jgi:predicted dehydrogenase
MQSVIVVGAGNWGKNLVSNFHALGALAGVVELSPKLREGVASAYPDVPLYDDFQTALNETAAMAVAIATPAPTHYELAMRAMGAEKDVFVEKPMTLTAAESIALAEYADKHDRVLMVGHLLLYQPAIAWMRDYIAAGKLGEVKRVVAQRAKLGKVRSVENVWWSFSPHDVSVVLELLGRPQLVDVKATGCTILQPEIEDEVRVEMTFAGGKTAHIHASWLWPINQRGTIAIGSQGMLVYDEVAQTVSIHHKTVDSDLNHHDDGIEVVEVAAAQPLQLECQHFLDCLASRQKPRSDGWNGVAVVEVLEKAQQALKSHS